jgi:hypothetical protein
MHKPEVYLTDADCAREAGRLLATAYDTGNSWSTDNWARSMTAVLP